MSGNALIYKTKWGSTKQYAEWISEESNSEIDLYNIDEMSIKEIDKYKKIVIGSRTYMGKIESQDFMEENWSSLKDKDVYLFTVGMIPWEKPDAKEAYEKISPHIRESLVGHTKLPGRIDMEKLNFFQKAITKAMKTKELDKMDRSAIKPIVEFLRV